MSSRSRAPSGRAFWILAVVGTAVIGFGLAGLLRNAAQTIPSSWATFFVGGLLASDLVVLPAIALAGAVIARTVAKWARATVQGALLVSGALILVAIPVLSGRGRNPNNPSILPDDSYAGKLAILLAIVWGITALVLLARRARDRRTNAPRSPRRRDHEPSRLARQHGQHRSPPFRAPKWLKCRPTRHSSHLVDPQRARSSRG